jgi:hypothetical protein
MFVLLVSACQRQHHSEHGTAQPASVSPSSQSPRVDSQLALTTKRCDSTAAKSKDWLIVPGARVGPINACSTEAELKAVFAPQEVVRDSVFWFEGEYRPATVLFPKDPVRRISIVWKDEEHSANPERIELEGSRSTWHTAEGISLGTTAGELERLNGKPFRITSADYDYAGLAWSWENGTLEKSLHFLEVRLEPQFSADEQHPYSNDSATRVARPSVSLLYVYFPH